MLSGFEHTIFFAGTSATSHISISCFNFSKLPRFGLGLYHIQNQYTVTIIKYNDL
jgi:hypothetical protein